MSKFKYKGYVLGFIVGIIAMASTGAYAAVGDKVEAVFSEFNFKVNGKVVTLDQSPVVIDGSSYLPVKSISTALGYDVKYDADTRTINLSNTATLNPSNDTTVNNNKTYYSLVELSKKEIDKGNVFGGSVKFIDNTYKNVIRYKENTYAIKSNSDYYYDRTNELPYYSEDFLLSFLTNDDLKECKKYSIDFSANKVIAQN